MRPESKWLRIGSVRVFDEVDPGRGQALRVLEEASEVLEAYKARERFRAGHAVFDGPKAKISEAMKSRVVGECCDLIQEACNLLAAIGVTDLTEEMRECRRRNAARGRISR